MRRLLLVSLLGLCALAARGDDLDALLAQPPSASLSVEDARHRIEMLRALAAEHPDRADEIEAALIPFVRVAEPPPPPPTPAPPPEPAKPRPLLLVRSSDGSASLMRAVSVQKQGAVLLVVSETGTRAVLQASTIAGQLPWFTEEEIGSGAVNLRETANRYETFAMVVPQLAKELKREAARLRSLQQARDEASANERRSNEQRVADATAPRYDSGAGYPASDLAKLLLAAEKVRRDLPQSADRIDAWSVPFQAHFTKLLEGNSLVNGKWVSNADLARRAYEEKQEKFLGGLDYRISLAAAPEAIVRDIVAPVAAKAGFAILAGLLAVVLAWRWPLLRVAGAGLVVLGVAGAAGLFFLATRDPAALPAGIPPVDPRPVFDVLSQAAGLEPVQADPLEISDGAVNHFLARHVAIAGEPARVARKSLALRFQPGRMLVFQMVRSAGLSWIVELDLRVDVSGGKPSWTLAGARLGALACPRGVAEEFWKNLEPQLVAILAAGRLEAAFSLEAVGDGVVKLTPRPASSP